MIIDAVAVDGTKTPQYDLCIIGGGMAGIALAREFRRDRKTTVCVLEGGGERLELNTQFLYAGSAQMEDASKATQRIDRFLVFSRFRVLGGSGNAWGGKCGVLDPVDFAARPWMP